MSTINEFAKLVADIQKQRWDEHGRKVQEESRVAFDQKIEATLKASVNMLSQHGWTLPVHANLHILTRIVSSDDINGLVKFFTECNYAEMNIMISDILQANIKNGLKKVIEESWAAFENKLYSVCAIALLAVIEGILSDFSQDKADIRMKKICKEQIGALPCDSNVGQKYIWISYQCFIDKLYEKNNFNSDEPTTINRHWLLHGRSNFDIQEHDCIRLFNAIDSLCIIIKVHEKS